MTYINRPKDTLFYHHLSFAATAIWLVSRSPCLLQLYILSHYTVFTLRANSRLYIICENSSVIVSIIFKSSFPLRRHNVSPLEHQPVNAYGNLHCVLRFVRNLQTHCVVKRVPVNDKAGVSYRDQYDLRMITKTWRWFV